MSSHSRCGPVWKCWMFLRYCSGPGLPCQTAPVWWSETAFGVCGTYAWTGPAAPHASRDRTFGGRIASAGPTDAAETGTVAGAERFIEEGANVPSQAGFGAKIGGCEGAPGGGGSRCSVALARPVNGLSPAPLTSAAAEEISRRRRVRLMTAASDKIGAAGVRRGAAR